MKPVFNYNYAVMDTAAELGKNLTIAIKDIYDIFNGNINFADNILCTISNGNVFTNGVEMAVSHSLSKIPTGYLISGLSASAVIYKGTTAWTEKNIYLISSADVTADIIILGG